MKKFWLICWNEFKRHVMRKRFIFAILSMPFFVGVIILIGFLSVWLQYNKTPIGYVDSYQILTDPKPAPKGKGSLFDPVEIILYRDEASARTALDAKTIQAYFVLSQNYLSTGEVTMTSLDKTGNNIQGDFSNFITYNLIQGRPEAIVTRLTEGTNLIIRSVDGKREMGAENWMVMLLPIIAGLLFIIAVNVSGGYLLQAVVEEKENRTMEILVTSVSPNQLMAGKVVGNLAVGLTELIIWIFFAIIGLKIAPIFFPIGDAPPISNSYILLITATFLPAFVMIAAAMGAIGATATEMREAQQVAGFFTLPIMVPFWFITPIMFNPNGGIAVGLSLFPLTAPIALPLRAVFTDVPAWQIVLTISMLCALAAFSVWLAGRVFRLGMLRYGKKINLREAFKRVQG
jgi:ABC-2 type transport system permease protein